MAINGFSLVLFFQAGGLQGVFQKRLDVNLAE